MRSTAVLAVAAVAWMAPSSASSAVGDTPNSTIVSRIADERIGESSGLAYSVRHPGLVYTMNDSGNRPVVYAIQVSTGKVVGQTDLASLDLEDTESIAVDRQGRLWLGDLGDNDRDRDDVSIVSFEEPGPGNAAPRALQRYPVKYSTGPSNVEAMMIHPASGQVFLVSKRNEDGGNPNLFALPRALRPGQPNVATSLNRPMLAGISDAAFTPDGRYALMKTASGIVAYDVKTWKPITSFQTPGLDKGESLTLEPGGRSVLMGSEGDESPIVRMTLPAALAPAATSSPPSTSGDSEPTALPPVGPAAPNVTPAEPANVTIPTLVTIGGLGVLVAAAVVVRAGRRRQR
ncbi:MAG TPA: hypothetical protein VJ782_02965, partial [Aeromicrobium sp.]|nr:hypothetical protein [Aeromicrobium sp.]